MDTKAAKWGSWALSGLSSLMLLISGVMKLAGPPQLGEGFGHLGLPVSLAVPLGVLEIAVALVYLVPRTAVLGAILATGYMGGAILAHVRVGDPFLAQVLIGAAFWGGLYLREPRLRALIPLRS